MGIKNILIGTLLMGSLLIARECSYKKVFGFAKINKIEENRAYVSFTIEGISGKGTKYKESFNILAPWGVKANEVYPAILQIRQTGSCEKHKIMIIQEIGEACQVK